MKFLYLFLLSLILYPIMLPGQAKWKLENMHGGIGMGIGGNTDFSWPDVKNQSRDPSFPDYSMYGLRPYHGLFDIRLSGVISAAVTAGFYPFSKKRDSYNGRKEWQIGIFYQYARIPGEKYTNTPHNLYPTGTDSLQYLYLSYNIRRQYLGISNAITFRTNPESRLNIFGGAEFSVGVGIAGRINTYSEQNVSVRTDSGTYKMIYNEEISSHYPTRSAVLMNLRIFDGFGIRFFHHYYFSIRGGFDFGPVFYPHVSGGGRILIFESADLSIPLR